MTLTQLAHVLEAHRSGSFSRAARVCGVTQAALSNSIAKLEDELGERIFARTTRRVTLSPFGESLLPHVERMVEARDALAAVARARKTSATTVIGHSPLIPSDVLTRVVGAVRDAGFGTEIRLVEENLSDLLQRLDEHTVDLAIVPSSDHARSIRSAPVAVERLVYVPRLGVDAGGRTVDVESLAADTFVMVPDRCGLARTTRALFASAGVPLRVYAGEAMGYHVLSEWAALGLGSAILPESRVKDGTAAIPLWRERGAPAELTYEVAWHRGYARSAQLAALLRTLRPGAPPRSIPRRTKG